MLAKIIFEGQKPIIRTNKLSHNKAPVLVWSCCVWYYFIYCLEKFKSREPPKMNLDNFPSIFL